MNTKREVFETFFSCRPLPAKKGRDIARQHCEQALPETMVLAEEQARKSTRERKAPPSVYEDARKK